MTAATVIQVASDPTWAYIMTGATALAGIAATTWQARRAQKAEARNLAVTLHADAARAKLAEKRHIYAQCLAALTSLLRAAIPYQRYHDNPPAKADQAQLDAKKAAFEATAAAWIAISELRLIAPQHIGNLAATACQSLTPMTLSLPR